MKTIKECLDYWDDIDSMNFNGRTAVDLLFISHRMHKYEVKNVRSARKMNYYNQLVTQSDCDGG